MSRRKIPDRGFAEVLLSLAARTDRPFGVYQPQASQQMDALLAVAEAARTYRNCRGNLMGRAQTRNRKRLAEALARLEEVSGKGERR